MAQELQGRAEDNRGATHRVRRRYYKKNCQCSVARGHLSRGAWFMATGVVLYHLSPGHHLGGASCLSLGPPTTFNIVDQHGVRPRPAWRCFSTARPHKGSLERRPQLGQGDSSYADSPDSARPTPPSPLVGVQPGGAASSPKFHGHNAYGDV